MAVNNSEKPIINYIQKNNTKVEVEKTYDSKGSLEVPNASNMSIPQIGSSHPKSKGSFITFWNSKDGSQ